MNESINLKSAMVSTIRHILTLAPTGFRSLALCAALILANLSAIAFAQSSCSGIHVKILDIRNSTGAVACALFDAPEGFPAEFLHYATINMMIKVRDTQASCHFIGVPAGKYALAVIHDENLNGKLDTNWLGVPKEGYGFSSDAKASLSAPSFEAASFSYDGQNLEMTISLNY